MAQYVVSVLNVLLQLLLEYSLCVCFNKLIRSVIQTFCRLNFLLFCLLALSVTELCVEITYFDCGVVPFSLNYVVALLIFNNAFCFLKLFYVDINTCAFFLLVIACYFFFPSFYFWFLWIYIFDIPLVNMIVGYLKNPVLTFFVF